MKEKDLKFDRKKHCLYSGKSKRLIRKYLSEEFGKEKAEKLWEKIQLKFVEYMNDCPGTSAQNGSGWTLV